MADTREQILYDAAFDSDSRVRKAAKKIIATEIFDHGFSFHLRAMSTTKTLWANARKAADVIVGEHRSLMRQAAKLVQQQHKAEAEVDAL